MKKKLVSILVVCIMLMTAFAVPVAAADQPTTPTSQAVEEITSFASNYFNGSTGTMSSVNGGVSRIFDISSGTVPSNATVSSVTVSVSLSSGSAPCYINVVHPSGREDYKRVTSSGTFTFTSFNGLYPGGKWQVYLDGSTGVSTATARMTVNYTY